MMFPSNRVRVLVSTQPVDFRNYAERMIILSVGFTAPSIHFIATRYAS
jgi:hypothetical protein